MLSKACEYGIRAVAFIALRSKQDQRVSLKQVAKACDSPEAFTAKILQKLVRSGILHSTRGASGGFSISEVVLAQTTLYEVVSAIDGDALFTACGLGLSDCSARNPCVVHDEFMAIRKQVKATMRGTRLEELVDKMGTGKGVLSR